MSSRFSALIAGVEHKKGKNQTNGEKGQSQTNGEKGQSQTNGEKGRQNIFRQKPKPLSTQPSTQPSMQQNKLRTNNQQNNQFKKPSKFVQEFKAQNENFPTLSTNVPQITVSSTLSYSEKIKKHEEKTQKVVIIPKGYIILAYMTPKPKQKKITNVYYNPAGSKLIMDNRKKQREELNNLLGSMSPYWNMHRDTDDDDENDTSNPDILSEDEDQEYFDEW